MFKDQIKKSVAVLLTSTLVFGAIALPAFAKEKENGKGKSALAINLGLGNNAAIKNAQKTYRDDIKNANKAFQTAKQAAHKKFITALNSASSQADRITALKTYLADLLSAMKTRDAAKQAALQKLIDALGNVQTTNQAPTASNQNITTSKNTSKAITLTGSDPEGSSLIFTILTNPTHGTLSGTVPSLTYLPATDYTGSDSFTFKVNDGLLDSASATINLTVSP